jgi:Ni,Fe-hydrogenase III component G
MDSLTRLENGKNLLVNWIEETNTPEENRLDVWVSPENFKAAIKALVDAAWGYLITITGKDQPPVLDEKGIEQEPGKIIGLYHFAQEAAVLSICVKVPYDDPKLESICDLIPSATIYEREFMELFGVDLVDTPDRERLVLPDHWPEGVYPLRKNFKGMTEEEKLGKELSS